MIRRLSVIIDNKVYYMGFVNIYVELQTSLPMNYCCLLRSIPSFHSLPKAVIKYIKYFTTKAVVTYTPFHAILMYFHAFSRNKIAKFTTE